MAIPTFTSSIPASGQTLGNSRAQVNNNFGNYAGLIGVNHYAPNDINQGKHKFATFPIQASAPSTASGEGCLFTLTSAVNSKSELYYRQDNITTVNYPVVPVKAYGTFIIGGTTLTNSFNVTSIVRNSSGNYTVNLTEAVAWVNNVKEYTVQLTLGTNGSLATDALEFTIVSGSQFTIKSFNTQNGNVGDAGSRISFVVIQ
jgi:hypothetical protein